MAKKSDNIDNLYAVIMAGGKGTRFWPLSRVTFPKQFLRILNEKSLLQETVHRLKGRIKPSNIIVVTTAGQQDIVGWQLQGCMGSEGCIVEPEGKNTAPAIALAAFKLYKQNKNALMLVLPADHFIGQPEAFLASIETALPLARDGSLVTFGIKPSRPETGYGYIKAGKRLKEGVFDVARFIEKPNAKTAGSFVKAGNYFWNSGMFLFGARDILREMKTHTPDIHSALSAVVRDMDTPKEEASLKKAYARLSDMSIDYGVMEKSSHVVTVTTDFQWSDIGSWAALDEVLPKDENGNVLQGNVLPVDCQDSVLFSGDRLIAAIGLQGMVVVNTHDATLIVPKDRVQEVKDLVARLKAEGKQEYLAPRTEERPWGRFTVLERGPHYQIKKLYLKPGAKVSLQMHNHRSEHWIVVSGVAKVQRGDDVFFVNSNESTFIPQVTKHRLENPGTIPLEIIEIQSGQYLGEDDIIRFKDSYGRVKK